MLFATSAPLLVDTDEANAAAAADDEDEDAAAAAAGGSGGTPLSPGFFVLYGWLLLALSRRRLEGNSMSLARSFARDHMEGGSSWSDGDDGRGWL